MDCPDTEGGAAMDTIRVLLVDDEAEFRESTAKVLARRGMAVRGAESGAMALEMLAEEVPDVVVLDLRMPGMDGIETLAKIRERHGTVPVIILTGHGDTGNALAGISLEIHDFLQKPVEMERLAEKIRATAGPAPDQPLHERTVRDLMIPLESYRKVYADESLRTALSALKEAAESKVVGHHAEIGHRSILVMDRGDNLLGVLRRIDVLRMVEPSFLRDSPYTTYFTGMFLASCKTLADRPVGDFVRQEEMVSVGEFTPLMEAVALMARHGLINLPVLRAGKFVGMLRDSDLFHEVLRLVLG
jgi:DNA-binding response OmpR family regulator